MSDPRMEIVKAWWSRNAMLGRIGIPLGDDVPLEIIWVTSVEALLARIEAIESRMEEIEGVG